MPPPMPPPKPPKSAAGLPSDGTILKGMEALPKRRGLPPVHAWNPPFCGDLDMRIARDGTWFYMNSPIGRKRLVRLFSTILRHDDDGEFYLVTPVEKARIIVDDAPFVAVAMEASGAGRDQTLQFTTNVGDTTAAGPDAPIRFNIHPETGEPAPYVLVRDRLEALIARAVFYDLVELGSRETVDGIDQFGAWSGGQFFPFMPSAEMGA